MGEFANIELQERWPIVWVRYLDIPTDEEIEALLERYRHYFTHHRGYGISLISNPGARQTAAQNRRTGEWMKENRAHYEGRLRAMAFVSESSIMRFGLSMIFLIQPLTVPYTVVSNEADAESFLTKALAA